MNIYTFCIEQQFTLQQMSTIFSIFYFLFSYSFINANIVCEKSLALFAEILDFHSLNRPPFSYEIFNQHERDVIYNFGKMSFYRNYSLFENIFQYEVSICFFSKEPKAIPFRQLPSISHYELKSELRQGSENIPDIIKRMIEEREKEIEPEEENDEAENEIKDEKSEEEINEEKQMKKLRDFMNMFNQTNSLEQIKAGNSNVVMSYEKAADWKDVYQFIPEDFVEPILDSSIDVDEFIDKYRENERKKYDPNFLPQVYPEEFFEKVNPTTWITDEVRHKMHRVLADSTLEDFQKNTGSKIINDMEKMIIGKGKDPDTLQMVAKFNKSRKPLISSILYLYSKSS